MKKMMLDTALITGVMSLAGIMYLKMHPEKVDCMKETIKEMSRTIYNKLDTED